MKKTAEAELLTTEPPPTTVLGGSANALAIRPQSETERMFSLIEQMATNPAVDPAKLREILAVKQSWEADEARKAFAQDMAVFQSKCPIISKADKAYDKMYARIDRIHRETRELRKECGFWFTWSKCEVTDNVAHMEGILGHRGGHTIPLKQVIPLPDATKGMNATQRAGSSMSYAKRYGECLALDIVTGEDDDGNAAKEKPHSPTGATPKTREWMVGQLADIKDKALAYAIDKGIIMPDEPLESWPLEKVPLSKTALAELRKQIEAHQ